jgi:Ca-activated chloride channel homolog
MAEWLASLTFEFRDPAFLLVALLAPVVTWLNLRNRTRLTYSSIALVKTGRRGLRLRLQPLPAVLLGLAVVALALALAGPRTGDATTQIRADGIAIMLVVDRSGSMDARDFVADDYSISRLDAVKTVLEGFVLGGDAGAGRPHDLIGLIAFGTYADAMAPLTLDHGNLMAVLGQVEVASERGEAATAIGEGLGLAVERLRTAKAQSRVVVLLTDGVNNAGELDPLQAAELAANHDIRVYTIGAGSNGVAPMPTRGFDGRVRLRPGRVEIDEETLKRIAERTSGLSFNARDAEGLTRAYAAIDKLERTQVTEIRYLEYQDHFALPVIFAALILALAEILQRTWLRRLP